jgi:hypothetical protein
MAVRTDFAAGEVLAAQDLDDTFSSKVNYALPVNPQTGSGASAYTFVLADALRLTTASNASAGTYTIPPQLSVVWLANSVIRIVNYGAGVVTIAGGAGVTVTNATKTLSQFESAALIRTASNAWTLVPFSGAGNANFSNAATGTYTDGGIAYKYVTFTGSGTLTVTRAGLADVLIVGAGGGGGNVTYGGGGGGGGFQLITGLYLENKAYTLTIAGGGAAGGAATDTTRFDTIASIPGGGYGGTSGGAGDRGVQGASGGGGRFSTNGGAGMTGLGNAGGNSSSSTNAGGGGGAGGAGGSPTTAGLGLANSLTNTPVTYAAGGTGSSGGGAGGANTGNGGAGANAGGTGAGAGGSGVIIVRVRT